MQARKNGRRRLVRRRGSEGFGMLEALVAFAILGFAMLSFTTAAVALTRGEKEADSTASATALAIEQLELLRHLPLESPQHTPGNYAHASNPLTAGGDANGRYTLTWTVSNRDVPDFGLKTILVNVAWNDTRARSVRLGGFVRCSEVPCP